MIVDGARDDKGSKDNDVNQAAIVILCILLCALWKRLGMCGLCNCNV
jgi:hypothetical protein